MGGIRVGQRMDCPVDRMSPSGQLIAVAHEHMVEYLKAHPQPLSTPNLLNALLAQGKQMGLPSSSAEFGEVPPYCMTRREAYTCVLWSLRAERLLLTEAGTYKQLWHEFVPESERERRQ